MADDSEDLWRARLRRRDYPDVSGMTPPSANPAMLGYAPGTFAGIANLQPITILGPAVEGQPPTKVIDTTTSVRTWLFGPASLKAGRETVAHFVPYQWIAPGGRVLQPVVFRVGNGCLGMAPGVVVTVTQGSHGYTGTTDANGEVAIDCWDHSDPGDFDVTLDFPNSAPETRTLNLRSGSVVAITSLFDLRTRLTLYVTDPSGTVPMGFSTTNNAIGVAPNWSSFSGSIQTQGVICSLDGPSAVQPIAAATSYSLWCEGWSNVAPPTGNALWLLVVYSSGCGSSNDHVPAIPDPADDVVLPSVGATAIVAPPLDLTGIDLTGPFVLTFLMSGPYAALLYGGDTLITVSSAAP